MLDQKSRCIKEDTTSFCNNKYLCRGIFDYRNIDDYDDSYDNDDDSSQYFVTLVGEGLSTYDRSSI